MAKQVLFIMTNHAQVDSDHPTGVWLEEFTLPYEEFTARGYQIKVTSPKGGEVPIDPNSETEETRGKWQEARNALKNTAKLQPEDGEDFDAVFLPGGHGTMFDFPDDPVIQNVLNRFAEDQRIIGSVCHGPSGLVHVHLDDGTPLVSGKKVTAFTNEEEGDTGLKDQMPFLLESRLREQGAYFVKGDKWDDFTVRDGILITGQNPQSSRSAAKKVIEALEE